MSGNELISEVRTRAMGLETCTRFLILDMCDRLERKTRDCELLRQKVVKLLPRKPMTNADRFRAMSDEELAELLIKYDGVYDVYRTHGDGANYDWEAAVSAELEWLQPPAEGE